MPAYGRVGTFPRFILNRLWRNPHPMNPGMNRRIVIDRYRNQWRTMLLREAVQRWRARRALLSKRRNYNYLKRRETRGR